MGKHEKEFPINQNRRDLLLTALALGSGALLCPKVSARTLSAQEGTQDSSQAALDNQDAFDLWSNRLVASPVLTRSNPEPDEPVFFYYKPDNGFLPVEFDTDGQTDLAKMLPDTSANMKLAVNTVRPSHDHLDYIKRNKNGTIAVSIMPLSAAAPAKTEPTGDASAKPGATGGDTPSDHLIASVLPPPPAFDYHVSYPSGPSLVTNGAPLHAGLANWAWTFSVQQKAPKWQAFMAELQAATAGQQSNGGNHSSQTQAKGQQAHPTTRLAEAFKFVQGGVGSWETLSFLGVGLKIFNSAMGKTMAQTGKPHILLTLPNYQIITSKAGRQAAAGYAMPLLAGEYVAIPTKQIKSLANTGKAYELHEGVIVPAGSKDTRSALEQTLPDLTYVSFSVKFS